MSFLNQYLVAMCNQNLGPAPAPFTDVDIFIASLLAIIATFGILGNVISFYFFSLNRSKNSNSLYFNNIYILMTITDCLVCVLVVPVIHCLFTGRVGDGLFTNPDFRIVWLTCWRSATLTSVFLVGQMSVSRLPLLVAPTYKINKRVIVSPIVVPIVITSIIVGFNEVHITEIAYIPGISDMPKMYGYDKNVNSMALFMSCDHDPAPESIVTHEIINTALWAGLYGFPVILISVLCVISIGLLKKAQLKSQSQGGSTAKHSKATITIICVTLLYIFSNMPSMIFLIVRIIRVSDFEKNMSLRQMLHKINPSYFEKRYFSIVINFSFVVNSMFNPVMYFLRMDRFKQFICNGLKFKPQNITASTSNAVSTQ